VCQFDVVPTDLYSLSIASMDAAAWDIPQFLKAFVAVDAATGGREAEMAKSESSANLGFEAQLGEMADKTRGHMDASEYKHVVLG